MENYLKQITNKTTLLFIKSVIENLTINGRNPFEISRACVAWSTDTGLPSYDFRESLEGFITRF